MRDLRYAREKESSLEETQLAKKPINSLDLGHRQVRVGASPGGPKQRKANIDSPKNKLRTPVPVPFLEIPEPVPSRQLLNYQLHRRKRGEPQVPATLKMSRVC